MKTIALLLLVVSVAIASYSTDTIYPNDALAVHSVINNIGFHNNDFQVMIARDGRDINYLIAWEGEYYNPDTDDDDLQRLLSSIFAAGFVSNQTQWRSNMILVGFSNKMFGCTTASARYLVDHVDNMSTDEFLAWCVIYLIIEDY